MFDGVETIVLPANDISQLERLYTRSFGFTVMEEAAIVDASWGKVWGLQYAPVRSLLLGKPQSNGGWIRLVEVPELPTASPAGRPDRVGPYALDFYHRNAEQAEALLEQNGWQFRSPAKHYLLPGTTIPVRERMLEQPISGLVHASVQYRERGTRCVIDHDSSEESSEVVAVVIMTDLFTEATLFVRKVLQGNQYFTGVFNDPAVAEILALNPGEGFAAALFRGPQSRNARLEFAERIPGGNRDRDPFPRVIMSCATDRLETLQEQLSDGTHGVSTGIVEVSVPSGTSHRIGFRSRYGADFEFYQRS